MPIAMVNKCELCKMPIVKQYDAEGRVYAIECENDHCIGDPMLPANMLVALSEAVNAITVGTGNEELVNRLVDTYGL